MEWWHDDISSYITYQGSTNHGYQVLMTYENYEVVTILQQYYTNLWSVYASPIIRPVI